MLKELSTVIKSSHLLCHSSICTGGPALARDSDTIVFCVGDFLLFFLCFFLNTLFEGLKQCQADLHSVWGSGPYCDGTPVCGMGFAFF